MRQIFGNANDSDPGIIRSWQSQRDAPADRVFVGPVATGHSLIDYCYNRRALDHVLQGEIAALDQRNAERVKIIRARHLPSGKTQTGGIEGTTLDSERIIARKTT